MAYRLVPYTAEWQTAAQQCNTRLRNSGKSPFLLPAEAVPPASTVVRRQHYLVLDDANEVRGGCLLQSHPAFLAGQTIEAVNIQSPLSEGLFDRKFASVGPWMLREVLKQHPFAFCVGMGDRNNALPRLLSALAWRVEPVPFSYRILAGRRFLSQCQPLHRHPRFGPFAVLGGRLPWLSHLALNLIHRWRTAPRETPIPASPVTDGALLRSRYGFAVDRIPAVLDALYPPADSAFFRLTAPGALGIVRLSTLEDHPYFGNLRVATLAEAICQPEAARGLLRATLAETHRRGAELLLGNFSAPELTAATLAEGWLPYPSNFLVAFSPRLAQQIGPSPYYVTRGDGDGLLNL